MATMTKFAVLNKKADLKLHTGSVINEDDADNLMEDLYLELPAGTTVRVIGPLLSPNKNSNPNSNNNIVKIQVLNYLKDDAVYENLYECNKSELHNVDDNLWPFVINIKESHRRLEMLKDEAHCRWIMSLQKNDFISISGEMFNLNNVRYDCIIRHIGPVEELYPVGYFFGAELLNIENYYSPQVDLIPFSNKYMDCESNLSIFTTADYIAPISNDTKKKFSVRDTIDKFCSAFNNTGKGTSVNNNGFTTVGRKGKPKKREASAQFYDNPSTPPMNIKNKTITTTTTTTQNVNSVLLDDQTNVNEGTSAATTTTTTTMAMECDDTIKQSIQKYEKNLEQTYGMNGTDNNKQQQQQLQQQQQQVAPPPIPPAGILKNRDTNRDTATPSKYHITSLENKEIIVIDKADISASTEKESDVIVLENPRNDIELVELLGNNWPKEAGDAAKILNKATTSTTATTTKSDRNKSPNLLSHFGGAQQQHRQPINGSGNDVSGIIKSPKKKYSNVVDKNIDGNDNESITDYHHGTSLQELPQYGLVVGLMVEVNLPEIAEELYGVIRWIGIPPGAKNIIVGVELDEEKVRKSIVATNGTYGNTSLFKCNEGRAIFVTPEHCSKDRRFLDDAEDGAVGGHVNGASTDFNSLNDSKMFGQVECPSVPGAVAPLKILNLEELEKICGKFKGIQGHHNSCYLDATLFSMFTFTSVFDSLLYRPPGPEDISHYVEVQKVLRDEIVNPLRKNVFVRADRVMKLRQLLDKLSSVSGLTSEEKDPEEFLNSFLTQIMHVDPFLKLSSGQDAYFYQLFVEKDERLSFPTVQQLFEQSFYSSDIKLKEVPPCLIIQMPRFGKNFKMYPRILPSQLLDVTDIIEDSPRQCSVCGKLAEYECRSCFGKMQSSLALESTGFCSNCSTTVHLHAKRLNHTPKKLSVPQDFQMMAEHTTVPRIYMELFAVVCIETSHYVAFVKAGSGEDAPWCFFDSMADRKGEQNGYNIPEMITVPDLPIWLSDEGSKTVNETSTCDKMLPEHAKRLFCDAYMCMYQSTDVMMYR